MKHDVHIYTTVRVKVKGVEAESHEAAIATAYEQTNFVALFDRTGEVDTEHDYNEPMFYLVDEEGDEEYLNSTWYEDNSDGVTKMGQFPTSGGENTQYETDAGRAAEVKA
jgi:hypothetical protein